MKNSILLVFTFCLIQLQIDASNVFPSTYIKTNCQSIDDFTASSPFPNAGWNNSINVSEQGFSGDGQLSFTIANVNGNIRSMIGLSETPLQSNVYTSINYAVYLISVGSTMYINIYENGANKGRVAWGYSSMNDATFTITRLDGKVKYYINETFIYESAQVVTTDLFYDNSFYTYGTSSVDLSNIEVCELSEQEGETRVVTSCNSYTDINLTMPLQNAAWYNQFNVEGPGMEEDGTLCFTIDEFVGNIRGMIGLGKLAYFNEHFNKIDFAVYLVGTSGTDYLYIYESGVSRGSKHSIADLTGSTICIERVGTQVNYLIDGSVFYSSEIASKGALYFDNSIHKTYGEELEITNIEMCYEEEELITQAVDAKTIMVNSALVNGNIRIRWMTTEMKMWEHAIKVGYTIERITIKDSGTYLTEQERIDSYVKLEEMYLPKSQAELEACSSNPNEGTLANILLNDQGTKDLIANAVTGEKTLAKAIEQKEMRDNRYMFSHILAEKNFEMACAMGMAYEDATIETNKQYVYLVTLSSPLNP